MTYFVEDNYEVYDSLPCSAVVFEINQNLDIVYSNDVYNEMFASKYIKIINDVDREVFHKILADADEPKCVYFKSKNSHGEKVDVRAFVIKISDERAFALFIDESEHTEAISNLGEKVTRYAAAIRGTDETFYEYNKSEDKLTIFFSSGDGKIDFEEKRSFFGAVTDNDFVYEADKDIIRCLDDNVKVERRFEIRLKIRGTEGYEWYSVIARPDEKRPGMFIGSARNIHKNKAEEEKLKEKALIDPLSKVYNRAAAIEKIEQQLAVRPKNSDCALIVLDIDNFKRINDTFGHLYGDAVIAMAAGSIKSTLDEADIMGRFGGDEFFVFIDNANKEYLEKKLENIRQAVLKMRLDANDDNDISCSIGVALGKGGDVYEELFKKADSALYKAKENGKNRFEYFDGTYTDEAAISYTERQNEDESNEEHNVTAIALEIASKSTNSENAIINIVRHIGIALNLDFIQIMKFDTLEDRVDLQFQWLREQNGEYNVVITQKRSGYYAHNDLIIFQNRFAKEKIFRQTVDFEEGFSQKYQDVFKNMRHVNYLHSSNTENEDIFYAITFQSLDLDRVWTEQEIKDMSEITKILSMYLKSSYVETEREKMLIRKIDYDMEGAYTLAKFYDESGRITRGARAEGNRMGMLHIDIQGLFSINIKHNWEIGNEMIVKFSKMAMAYNQSKAITCRYTGTDAFVVLFHTAIQDDNEIAAIVEKALEEFCAPYAEYDNPKVLMKAGLSMFEPGNNIGYQIDVAKYTKKGKKVDKCTCFISEL